MNTEPSEREEAPERVFLKACHPARPNRNCSWDVSKTREDSVEYVRADLSGNQIAGGDTNLLKEVVARIERQIRLWNNDTVTMACADMLADIKQLPTNDAALRMRERCVARVKEMRKDWQTEAEARRDPDNPHDYKGSYGLASGAVDACDDIITALESLTLDGEQEQ